jgi:crotonobetainyl-CoA:carnitine CoA-transferase CaiB-like acyl-CoA transferase
MPGALEGLRVVDCSRGEAGWRATGLLSDYGADVVWVEPPGGDSCRRILPAAHSAFNRGKRSVVLDLTEADDRARLAQLVERADVFVESWRPGTARRLGLGWPALRDLNPELVACSISGFGEHDERDLLGYEEFVHAAIGTTTSISAHREGPVYPGLPFASIGAAYMAAIGILAALCRRTEDGHGRWIATSLVDGALAFMAMGWSETDVHPAPDTTSRGPAANLTVSRGQARRTITRSFLCADDEYVGIHTGARGAFGRLMKVLGVDDRVPATDSGMAGTMTAEQSAVVDLELPGIFASKPSTDWVEQLLEADVCCIEHLHPAEVFDQPQTRHNQMVVEVDDPVLGTVQQVAPPARFDRLELPRARPAPRPGADTDSVFSSLWAERPQHALGPVDDRPLLQGLRILDFGHFFAGPYSSRLLADFGADVIKVEPVGGDQLRGLERIFAPANSGKRSLALDLKDPELAAARTQLLEWAEVVHHNLRPGAAERLGFGVDQVRAVNPDAIYLYAPGWGSSGPHMQRQSFAPMMSGYVGVTYEIAGEYNPPMPAPANEDPGNGMLGAFAILAALYHKRRTGVGLTAENPQLNATMLQMAHVVRTADGTVVGAAGLDVLQFGVGPLRRLYETLDGWLLVTALSDEEATAVGRVAGIDFARDERFGSEDARRAHVDVLADLLGARFATRRTDELLAALRDAGVPATVPSGLTPHAILNDAEWRAMGRTAECPHPTDGNVRELGVFLRAGDTTMCPHRLASPLGADNDEVLAWLGYKDDQIDALRARGAIR